VENALPAASKEPDTQERPVQCVLVAGREPGLREMAERLRGLHGFGVVIVDELPDNGVIEIPAEFAGKQVVIHYGPRRRDIPTFTPQDLEAVLSPAPPALPPTAIVRTAEGRPSPSFTRNMAVAVALAAAPCRESDRATQAISRRNRSGLNAHFPAERGPNWLKMALNSQR
jgi:hypothetical protein